MSAESEFIAALRPLARHPAARDLRDDAAVLELGGATFVLTTDMLVEGVHFRSDDPPGDVAWKLLAVNLSDLAAKAARPIAAMLGFMLGPAQWDRAFADGLRTAFRAFAVPLIGGDTVAAAGGPRVLSLTAIGAAAGPVPARSGAQPGNGLWISGSIGDAGAGLAVLAGEIAGDEALVRRYRAPRPRLEAGLALGPLVSAMMDVSDGLLIDAARLGHASAVGVALELEQIPLSEPFLAALGGDRAARLRAATAGDDYELLFTAPAGTGPALARLAEEIGLPLTRIGRIEAGAGLTLTEGGASVELPPRLGYEHGRAT